MNSKSAVIIKGNPELVTNNERADIFYNELKSFLESLGFSVSFDSGEPYTAPQPADLWVGHSRGSDRLRFAPFGTLVLGIGVPDSEQENDFPIVNHQDDEMVKRKYDSGIIVDGKVGIKIDDSNHYLLTEEMKKSIADIIKRGRP